MGFRHTRFQHELYHQCLLLSIRVPRFSPTYLSHLIPSLLSWQAHFQVWLLEFEFLFSMLLISCFGYLVVPYSSDPLESCSPLHIAFLCFNSQFLFFSILSVLWGQGWSRDLPLQTLHSLIQLFYILCITGMMLCLSSFFWLTLFNISSSFIQVAVNCRISSLLTISFMYIYIPHLHDSLICHWTPSLSPSFTYCAKCCKE